MLRSVGLAVVVAACNSSGTPPPSPNAPADCVKVAEIVANFELGPGAKPDVRTPVVAKHHESCKSASVTAGQATCIAKAKATWDMIECAPAMFPARAADGECKAVTGRMREGILVDIPPGTGSAGTAMVDKMMAVIEASCREDSWPTDYRKCVTSAPAADHAAVKKCGDLLPQATQFKLGERLKPIVTGTPAPAP